MRATLELESGHVFEGFCGKAGGFIRDIVFNTSMNGVTELLTDPSSLGQALVLTYPMIGNCGVSFEDFQSEKPQIAALIVSEMSEIASNFRSEESLKAVLERFEIPVIAGVDTRSLVRLLRSGKAQRARISLGGAEALEAPKAMYPGERRSIRAEGAAVIAVPDTGLRKDLAQALASLGVSLEIFPYGSAMDGQFDGYLLPGGPGNPAEYDLSVVKHILQTQKPVLAAGLGHQLLALANGGKAVPLSPGHRGANIPVRDTATGKAFITGQNHGYAVDTNSVDKAKISHVNVNDGTVEGLRWREDILSVQFQPEMEMLSEFVEMLKR
ncbi:MAG: carbamoyl phosphate synthase small subunit [Oscillospiraceae bacterium]|nr:carbamoyl phosphate synthase small subunit [Oscillospiraceae bacterium]